MSLRSLVVTAAVGLGAVIALPAVASAYTNYTIGSVNQRTGPSVGYPKIGSLPPGTAVNVSYCQLGWCAVSSFLGGGWVSAGYLSGAIRPYPTPYPPFVVQPYPRIFPQPYPRIYPQPYPSFQLYIGPRRWWW